MRDWLRTQPWFHMPWGLCRSFFTFVSPTSPKDIVQTPQILSWYYVFLIRRWLKVWKNFIWKRSEPTVGHAVGFLCHMWMMLNGLKMCHNLQAYWVLCVEVLLQGLQKTRYLVEEKQRRGRPIEHYYYYYWNNQSITFCFTVVGAKVKPASGLGSWQGLLFHSRSANVTMTTESSEWLIPFSSGLWCNRCCIRIYPGHFF